MSEFSRLSGDHAVSDRGAERGGSQFTFNDDPDKGVYVSVDGAGAYGTIAFNPYSVTGRRLIQK